MDLVQTVARAIWNAESVRIRGADRSVDWDDGISDDDRQRYRHFGQAAINALRSAGALREWRRCHPDQFSELADTCACIIHAPSLVDADFNPDGIAEACLHSDDPGAPFEAAKWCVSHDHYVSVTVTDATHFQLLPPPPEVGA